MVSGNKALLFVFVFWKPVRSVCFPIEAQCAKMNPYPVHPENAALSRNTDSTIGCVESNFANLYRPFYNKDNFSLCTNIFRSTLTVDRATMQPLVRSIEHTNTAASLRLPFVTKNYTTKSFDRYYQLRCSPHLQRRMDSKFFVR